LDACRLQAWAAICCDGLRGIAAVVAISAGDASVVVVEFEDAFAAGADECRSLS